MTSSRLRVALTLLALAPACSTNAARAVGPLAVVSEPGASPWMEPHFELIAGLKIQTVRAPRPGAPRVLILAPWPETVLSLRSSWPWLTSALDVTAIDLPGFGRSDPLPGPSSPSALSAFLALAFAHFGLEQAHLVGTDVGVPVALSFAEAHGDRLRSLVLADGPGTADATLDADLRRMEGSSFFRWFYSLAPATFIGTARARGYVHRAPSDAEVDEYVAAARVGSRLRGTMDFIATYPTELPRIDGGLARVTAPALLLWGQSDAFVPAENAERLHRRLAGSAVKLLDAGHFANDDDPEGWAKAVRDWCLQHEPASSVGPRAPL